MGWTVNISDISVKLFDVNFGKFYEYWSVCIYIDMSFCAL